MQLIDKVSVLFFSVFLIHLSLFSQPYPYFRIEADFSIKEKTEGTSSLSLGHVFYDINTATIIYDIKFPEKERILITDSLIIRIKNNRIVSSTKSSNLVSFSIFNLALSGNFLNYGLMKTNYKISNIEKEKESVISTWTPPKNMASKKGKIMLCQKNNSLNGIVSFAPDGKIISKQFFEEYQTFQNIRFPQKVVQIFYYDKSEGIKITTFKNVLLNNLNNNEIYNYRLPAH